MYKLFKSDRLTYIQIAKELAYAQPNIEKPNRYAPILDIELEYQKEFERLEK